MWIFLKNAVALLLSLMLSGPSLSFVFVAILLSLGSVIEQSLRCGALFGWVCLDSSSVFLQSCSPHCGFLAVPICAPVFWFLCVCSLEIFPFQLHELPHCISLVFPYIDTGVMLVVGDLFWSAWILRLRRRAPNFVECCPWVSYFAV